MPMPTTLAASLARRLHAATAIGLGLLLTAVILTQSLRFLEVALRADLGPAGYLALIGLGLPRILGHVLPFAVGGAVVFVLVLAARDGLVTVVQASGVGPAGLLLPVLALAVPAAGLQAALDYALVPAAEEALDARRDGLQGHAGARRDRRRPVPGGRTGAVGLCRRGRTGGPPLRPPGPRRPRRGRGAHDPGGPRPLDRRRGPGCCWKPGSIQVDRAAPPTARRALPSTVDFDRYAFDLGGDADAAGPAIAGARGRCGWAPCAKALAEARRAAPRRRTTPWSGA